MSRSKKDGRGGGNHRTGSHRGTIGYEEIAGGDGRRFFKKQLSKDDRRISKEIEFEEGEKELRAEDLAGLGLPTLDYSVYVDVTRALEQNETPDRLLNFLVDVAEKSDLLEDSTYVQGLVAIAKDSENWIRPPETWQVEADDRGEQFTELTRHLFCSYDVPRFMDNAWLDGNPIRQNWFKHIGSGKNIRTAPGLPFVLTKKMAHHFLSAPEDYTIEEALRWGQVHGLDGNINLVEALRETYLVRVLNRHTPPRDFWFAEDHFWMSVIRFFVRHPMFDVTHVGSVIDYIRHQKYGDPQRNIAPEHPNFSMKGRTPERLFNAMDAWYEEEEARRRAEEARQRAEERRRVEALPFHQRREHLRLSAAEDIESSKWERSDIGEFGFRRDGEDWHIRELRNAAELRNEGAVMNHCVATYLVSCHKRTKSIWTMETAGKKALTIAVDIPSKSISEVRGESNRSSTREEQRIIAKWAEQEGLNMPSYI